MTNERIEDISRETLEREYEMSQWALAHALRKLGGLLTITEHDVDTAKTPCRVWYAKRLTDAGATVIHVELQEYGTVEVEL